MSTEIRSGSATAGKVAGSLAVVGSAAADAGHGTSGDRNDATPMNPC